MQSRALEVLVGFFVCLGVAAIFVLTMRVASLNNLSSGKTYHVVAKFDNIGSLAVGASVKLAGVRIGRVTGIAIDPQTFQAVAQMDIDSGQDKIPKDSTAKIMTSGLLGEQYIGLEPGGDDQSLKNGDELQFTQSAFVLENLIGQFAVNMTQNKSGNGNGNNSGGSNPQAAAPAAPTSAPQPH